MSSNIGYIQSLHSDPSLNVMHLLIHTLLKGMFLWSYQKTFGSDVVYTIISEHAVYIFREFDSPYLLCDCNLQWLVVWIKEKAVVVKETRCSFPRSLQGQLITSLKPETLTCGKNTLSQTCFLSCWRFYTDFCCIYTEVIFSNPHTNNFFKYIFLYIFTFI